MNRVVVLIAGGGAVALLVVGALAGAILAGGVGGESTPTAVDPAPISPGTPTPEPTPVPTADAATAAPTPAPTPGSTPTSVGTPTPERSTVTPVPPEDFDEGEIATLVARFVSDRREAANRSRLDDSGSVGERLASMARGHSVAMADEGTVGHEIDGQSSADRYEANDLYQTCQWVSEDNVRQVTPDDDRFEAVSRTTAGEEYDDGGETRFHGNETAVARAVVDEWWDDRVYGERLRLPGAEQIGVGVEATRTSEVYVTANLCGA